MAQLMLKFIIAITIIHRGFILVHTKYPHDKPSYTISEHGEPFKLSHFIYVYYVNVLNTCGVIPSEVELPDWAVQVSGVYYADDFIMDMCPPGTFSLNWEKDDYGLADNATCPTVESPSMTKACSFCVCQVSIEYIPRYGVHTISMMKQESNLANNKVVTGLKLMVNLEIIYIQIQEATLLKNGTVFDDKIWKPVPNIDINNPLLLPTANTILGFFTELIPYLYLDEIFLPHNYIVTGVNFDKIDGDKGFKLVVKGTKFDGSYRLLDNTSMWFDYRNSARRYTSSRKEIRLTNCDPSDLAPDNTDINDTNYYLKFRAARNYTTDPRTPMIPYFSGDSIEAIDGLPLRGVGLSYKGSTGFGGFITVKAFPDESFEVKPKYVSVINLRTTTTTNEPIIVLPKNISTKPPPILDPKLKRMRTYPVNVSCREKSQIGSHQEATEDIFVLVQLSKRF